MDAWEQMIEFYREHMGIPRYIVEYLSVDEYLSLCVSGLSNRTISRHLDVNEETVREVLEQYIDFSGWDEDLDINVWMVYDNTSSEEEFRQEISLLTNLLSYGIIGKAYQICTRYDDILQEIDRYYG